MQSIPNRIDSQPYPLLFDWCIELGFLSSYFLSVVKLGAGKETRTLDIFLGKEVLYQLSYTRKLEG